MHANELRELYASMHTSEKSEPFPLENIVRIHLRPSNKDMVPNKDYSGTGILLTNSGYLLTANHVIRKVHPKWQSFQREFQENPLRKFQHNKFLSENYFITTQSDERFRIDCSYTRTLPQKDLALLKVELPTCYHVSSFAVRKHSLEPGERVSTNGYTKGNLTTSRGFVTDTNQVTRMQGIPIPVENSFTTSSTSYPGNSGGAYIDEQGRLAGMILFGNGGKGFYSGGVEATDLTAMVTSAVYELENQYNIARCRVLRA